MLVGECRANGGLPGGRWVIAARDGLNACAPYIVAVICAFLAQAHISSEVAAQGGPTQVGVATAEFVEITDTRPVLGQLAAAVEANIAARTAGIVAGVLFEIGDNVAKGSVLVRLDQSQLQIERRTVAADVEVAKSGIAVAEAQLKRAVQTFERQAALRSSGAFSRSRYEDLEQDAAGARGTLSRAQAELQRATARLAEIDYRLRHAEIVAPFPGVVISRHAQPGAYITVGAAVATLMDISKLEVEADVPVALVAALNPGRDVTAAFDNGTSATAKVRAIIPVQSLSTRTRAVRFTMDFSAIDPLLLARGMSVSLSIPASAPRKALTIPKDALVQSGTGWIVYVIEENKAVSRPVVLGQSASERIEVTLGVTEGEIVVVRGNERLRPGQSVAPNRPDPPPKPVPPRNGRS